MIHIIIARVVCGALATVLGVFLGVSFSPGLREKFSFLKWPDGARRLWLFILFVICVVSYLVLSEMKPALPHKEPIVLSSDRIDLGSGDKKAINNFLVRNAGEVDLYQVTVKLVLMSDTLSFKTSDVGVELIQRPAGMELQV